MKLTTKRFVIVERSRILQINWRNEITRMQNPTVAELELLKVLWEHGPCTVSHVRTILKDSPPRRYTTILKLLQIMTEKGLVSRGEQGRAHVYRAAVSNTQVHRNYVRHLLTMAFDNSAGKLIAQALTARPVTKEELDEIKTLIDKMETEQND